MSVISLISAKGSPGVTTCAVALTLEWAPAFPGRRALLVDADMAGGDTAAGVLQGALAQPRGMLSLAATRGDDSLAAVDSQCVDLTGDGAARLLPGVPDPARRTALVLAWDHIRGAGITLGDCGTDVLVDAGRLDPTVAEQPWLEDSDVALLVVRPTLPAVSAAHRLVQAWRWPGVPIHVLVVDAPSAYRPVEVSRAVGAALVHVVPFDPPSARVHSEGVAAGRSFVRTEYSRSFPVLAHRLGDVVRGSRVPGRGVSRGAS